MGLIQNIRAYRLGQQRGRRSVQLANEFMETHLHNPPQDLAKRFFIGLFEEIGDNPYEYSGARKVYVAWQQGWVAAHPAADRTFRFPFEMPIGERLMEMMGMRMVEVDPAIFEADDPVAALRDAVLEDAIQRDPMVASEIEATKRMNLEAGYCLGCGGGIDAEGLCDGTPPVDGFGNSEQGGDN